MVVNTRAGTRNRSGLKALQARLACHLLPLSFLLSSGCTWDRWNLLKPTAPPGPTETLVLRGDRMEPEAPPAKGSAAAELGGGHALYRAGDYSQAEKVFHYLAENKKNPPGIAEEARFYEAECLRRQAKYPKAKDTYNRMLLDFPSGQYREQAVNHMYEIANYWLDDTRVQMAQYREKEEGKRSMIWPGSLVHFEREKPFLDEEGRAIEALEQVRYNDMTGPYADKALYLAGSVKFFREDYKEADHLFSQLVEMHPNSPYASQALELGLISKQLSTGGSDYDGRKVAEARQLVDMALRNYPELVKDKNEFLNRQLISITMQQAEKDYKIAEFYKRTGHPCSAYFYYEIVRRRYPGTKYFDLATERMHELRAQVEKETELAAQQQQATSQAEQGPQPRPLLPPGAQNPERGPMPRPLPLEMMK